MAIFRRRRSSLSRHRIRVNHATARATVAPPMEAFLKLLGARIRELRTERGLSVAQLAAALGCNQSSIYNIESGRHPPSLRHLADLARTFRVDEMDILCFPSVHVRHALVDLMRHAPVGVVADLKTAAEKALGLQGQGKAAKDRR